MQETKRIMILGAGFGGLRTAIILGRKLRSLGLAEKYEVILADRKGYHTYTPLLYEIATTSKEIADIARLQELVTHEIAAMIAPPVCFWEDEITAIDAEKGAITFKTRSTVTADFMVLALGSETNYFNIPGLRTHALSFKTFTDAIRIRDTIWNLAMNPEKKLIRIVIGGAGSTGVELAGELQLWEKRLRLQFPQCHLNITLVEAAATLLPGFDRRIIQRATRRLRRIGVVLERRKRIVSAEPGKVFLDDGTFLTNDIVIWAGGIHSPSLLSKMPLKNHTAGRVEVGSEMVCIPDQPDLKIMPRLYGIGDNICCFDPVSGKATACVAQAALAQAKIAAHNIIEDIKLAEHLTDTAQHILYWPKEYPYIIPIGGKYAIAKMGFFVFSGITAWFLKGLVELRYMVSILPPAEAIRTWLKGLRVFLQNDRLG